MKTQTRSLTTLLLCLAVFIINPVHAALPGMKVIKLFGKGQTSYGNRQFGAAVAINETYAVVGEPALNATPAAAGAVHVFNAVTGAFIRTLKPTTSVVNNGFGASLAINGKMLLVGADGQSFIKGACYLYDLSTGKLLKEIGGLALGDGFGQAVAMTDSLLYMGAPNASSGRGTVRVSNFTYTSASIIDNASGNMGDHFGRSIYALGERAVIGTDAKQIKLYKSLAGIGTVGSGADSFGSRVIGSGNDIFVAAPSDDFYATNAGAAHYLTWQNNTPLRLSLDDAAMMGGRYFGELMAVEGKLLVASVADGSGKSLIVCDLVRNTDIMTIYPESLDTDKSPTALALAAGRLLVGSATDSTLGTGAGAAYLIQTLAQPESFNTLLVKGSPAPGFADLAYNVMGDVVANTGGYAIARTTLAGAGSNAGKDVGLYSEVGHYGYFDSVIKSRQSYSGNLLFSSIGSPISNDATYSIVPATLSGPGLTAANNAVLLADSGSAVTTVLRTGTSLSGAPNTQIIALPQAAQSTSLSRVAVRADLKIGAGGCTALNDSAVTLQTHTGTTAEVVREDATISASVSLGQLAPRVSFYQDVYWLSAGLRGTGTTAATNAALFQKVPAGALTTYAVKGFPIPGSASLNYSTFLGEGGSATYPCVRATISGAGVTAANNEAIVFKTATIARKGTGGMVRFLRTWPMSNGVLIHAVISGPGITSANNEVLTLYQEDGTFSKLVQKGSLLPSIPGARIAAIQRVEVSTINRHYVVLASLSGTSATSNQVLLRGDAGAGVAADRDEASLRRPVPILRKGQAFNSGYAGNSSVTSIAIPNSRTQDATGVAHKGLGTVLSNFGDALVSATFSDGSTRLIRIR